MLNSVSNYVEKYTNILSSITNINIEVADVNLIRIAGTGRYAVDIGKSIKGASHVYEYVIKHKEPMLIAEPKKHAICTACENIENCIETLELCTPIIFNNNVIGVIAIVCFSKEERERILSQLDLYKDFVQKISEALSHAVREDQNTQQIQNILDTFLEITDANNRGIITLDNDNRITYFNGKAKEYLGISSYDVNIEIKKTGDTIAGMHEFLITIDDKSLNVVGDLVALNSNDESFARSFTFDLISNFFNVEQGGGNDKTPGLSTIIGDSKIILNLKQQILKIANTKSTVLITGESGTGKEIFARAIHQISNRADKPFIAINCGAIPDTLLESELFGYMSGAFTGARGSGHIGKFEIANGGVLFLDEIGAMPLYLQVKLLRVLQERTITRLGSNRVIAIDVRIIAATNDDLAELIEQKMFREDLYYRLNVIPLKLPTLKERMDDIPVLAGFFLDKYCQLFDKKNVYSTPRVIKALMQYSWPGNVREFENVMEYLVNIVPNGGSVTYSMLPAKIISQKNITKPQEIAVLPENYEEMFDEIMPLDIIERRMIEKALHKYGKSTEGKKQAAEALGIGIATLYRKLRE